MKHQNQQILKSALSIKIIISVLFMSVISYSYADNNLKGKSVTLTQKKGVMVKIPTRALVFRNGVPGVFVVQNNEARFRMVRVGKKVNKSVYILAGLFGNETVLTGNTSTLFDGMSLNKYK